MNTEPTQRPKLNATIAGIRSMYDVPPQAFVVGFHPNDEGTNEGSLAILGFAKAHNLPDIQTLSMFGEAWDEVRANPEGADHPNIRAFLIRDRKNIVFVKGGIVNHPEIQLIEDAWEHRADFTPANAPSDLRDAVDTIIGKLDNGTMRAAMKLGDFWWTNQAVKKAVLLSFRLSDNKVMGDDAEQLDDNLLYFDKVPLKFGRWKEATFREAGFRVVPGAIVRHGSFIGKNVVLMPSFVNIGAYVGEGTMVDAWATVGSCAQIGKDCHLSGGVGIGGVLEPLQANPTIIGDNCFIGARSEIVEGVIVEDNCVISMGVYIGQSTKIYDRATGKVSYGRIPEGSVVVPGSMLCPHGQGLALSCAVIVKKVDAQTRAKTSINELLRD